MKLDLYQSEPEELIDKLCAAKYWNKNNETSERRVLTAIVKLVNNVPGLEQKSIFPY